MVTIKDISKQCDVSPATVSKALNGYGDVGKETTEWILRAAREMHYMPNAAARQLKTNTSHNIGVVFEDETMSGLTHEYFSQILNSAKNTVEALGYDITFISQTIGGRSFAEHCRYRKCDGVLIASVDFTSPAVRELIDSEFPTVTIDYSFNDHSCVMSDNVNGAYRLVHYLYDKGHRKIAFIHGEQTSVTQKRLSGFYKACGELGIDVPDEYVIEGRYHDTKVSAEATRRLMERKDPPTAILYPDDFSYIGGSIECERMGISIPGDLSVVGYDGIHLSQVIRPKLTTWYQDAVRIGEVSGRKLVESIEHKKSCVAEELLVEGKLLEGQTVKDISENRQSSV